MNKEQRTKNKEHTTKKQLTSSTPVGAPPLGAGGLYPKPMNSKPHYQKIFMDMIEMKYPDKKELCLPLLAKEELTEFDVIHLSNLLNEKESLSRTKFNQNRKTYSVAAIQEILNHQKEYGLNDSETAQHFKMSTTTLKKWKDLGLS